jgi:tRNA(Glu) U13 pseudouridine synthase TruD
MRNPSSCHNGMHTDIAQSYFWNFTVSHRIKTYGLAVVVGDLVFDKDSSVDANTVPSTSEQADNDDDIDMVDTDFATVTEVCERKGTNLEPSRLLLSACV